MWRSNRRAFALYEVRGILAAVLGRTRLERPDRRPQKVGRSGITVSPALGTPAGVQSAPFDQLSLPSFQSLVAENAGTPTSHNPAKTSPRKLHDIRESPHSKEQ